MFLLFQLAASLLILIAFIVPQLGRATAKSGPLLIMNLVGATVLCVEAAVESQWGFVILEGVWACVAAIGLAVTLTNRWRSKAAPSQVAC